LGALNHNARAGTIRFQTADLGSKSRTAALRSTKKQQSGSSNPETSGGRVMVHRTDIAGSVGWSMGQSSPGDDGRCRHAWNGAPVMVPSSKSHLPKNSATSYFGGKKCGRLFMTAVLSVHAIYVETLGPMKH
jgi:hypothetical protein